MHYWAFDWLNDNRIHSSADVDRALRDPTMYKGLQATARKAERHEAHPLTLFPNSIVAGRGIGITGLGANANRRAIVAETAGLLRRVWHFFDKVVLQDLAPAIADSPLTRLNQDALAGWLESLLLIQKVGAADICMFMSTESLCKDCGSALGRDLVAKSDLSVDDLAAIFAEDTKITLKGSVNGMRSARLISKKYSFDYIAKREASWFEGQSRAAITRSLLWPIVGQSVDQFGMEWFFADYAGVGLGTASSVEAFMLRRSATLPGDRTNEIAFDIEIPYVSGVPLETLFKVRIEEQDAFAQYQSKLRSAIRSRLQTAGQDNHASIALEIYRDEIEKPVLDLKRRLHRNTALLEKQWAAAAVGVVMGAVGLMANEPSVTLAGLGGAFAMAPSIAKAAKDRDDLEARDTFFIFEAGDQPDFSE